jgi:hypothetical protein
MATTPGSSWEAASADPHRHAASPTADTTAKAIVILLAASRKRSMTVQWMPDEHGQGCRFEVIGVHTGNYLAIVDVDENGNVRERDGV